MSGTDQRFVLANERTYLAYVRTALALMAAGGAILQLGDILGGEDSTRLVGAGILVVGILVAVLGYVRWRDNDRRIAEDLPLRTTPIPLMLGIGVVAFGVVVLVLSLV
ncbi:YidH family protein [Mumia sp. DW29H23]|uniref:YidH family protein n=1 Tax=Mumia sp. DW29H23 TaxID=3421241 RepID=UPI003D686579